MKQFLTIISFLFTTFSFAQEYSSEIIKSVSHIELKGDKLIRNDSTVIQINERMGDSNASVAIVYSKGDKINIGDAWIEDMNGKIVRKLKGNEITDQSFVRDVAFYSDMYIKWFELKHNVYPYRIVYSVKTTTSKFMEACSYDYTRARYPIRHKKVIVETPIDQPLKYKQSNIPSPQIDTTTKTMNYTWEFDYTPSGNDISSSLNTGDISKLVVLPYSFKFGEKGTWDSWQSYGNWNYSLNNKKDDLPDSEKSKISSLIKGVTDAKEKAKILYHYLQDNHRYINVSVKTGGLESYPASYVCTNRYGDCKALSNYMKSVLNYAGIKSYYTLIDSDERVVDIDPVFPSNSFNHVIVTVPFGNDTIYLECTSKNLPFGYVHSSMQGRRALMIDKDESCFTSIPQMKPDNVLCERTIQITGNPTGHSNIELKAIQRGQHFELSNELAISINKNNANKYIRETILSGAYDLLDYKFDKKGRDDNSIILNAHISISNMMKKYGNNLLIPIFPIEIPLYEKPENREQDLQLDMPEYYKDSIIYNIDDITISKIPENIILNSPYGEYSINFKLDGNKLIISKTILIPTGRYTLSDYKGFYKFISAVRDSENKKYNLEIL